MKTAIGCVVIVLGIVSTPAWADGVEEFVVLRAAELQWQPSPFPGVDSALLAGDPDQAGLYIMRARFQPGHMTPPHFHSRARYVTVISGVWYVGTDASFDPERTRPLLPGDFMKHPIGAIHYDGAKDVETIVEVRGLGPVLTELVNAEQRDPEAPETTR